MFTHLQHLSIITLLLLSACSNDTSSEESNTTKTIDIKETNTTNEEPISQNFDVNISLTLSNSNAQEIAEKSIYSSTQLKAKWINNTKLETSIDHFNLQLSEVNSTAKKLIIEDINSSLSNYTLTQLKSSTAYEVTLIACQNKQCSTSKKTATQTLSTDEEYWQIKGGNNYDDADKVANNTNTKPYARKIPSTSESYAGRTLLYYGPKKSTEFADGCYIAVSNADNDTYDNIANFETTIEGTAHGLIGSCAKDDLTKYTNPVCISTTQAITLKSGGVRLFFEATTSEDNMKYTRSYSIDSKDGDVGLDFNSDPLLTLCTPDDYQKGGNCEIKKDIGVIGDTDIHSSYFINARQGKIGFPTLDSMAWDESNGTFRVITASDSCGLSDNGLFYSTYDGSDWYTYTQDNCAVPLVKYAHGPVIQHLGQSRYKLYYEDATPLNDQEDPNTSSKPFHLIYANGANTGLEDIVDFDDWESGDKAREVNFVWSDGTLLTTKEESGIGDHMVYVPSTLEEQYIYVNLGGLDNPDWNKAAAGIGIAKLLNP